MQASFLFSQPVTSGVEVSLIKEEIVKTRVVRRNLMWVLESFRDNEIILNDMVEIRFRTY